MIQNKALFERLIREAQEHDFSGWDWPTLLGGWSKPR